MNSTLKVIRKELGLSVRALADKMGNLVTQQALSQYELGKINLRKEVLIALADVLNLPPDFFVNDRQLTIVPVEYRIYDELDRETRWQILRGAYACVEQTAEWDRITGQISKFANPLPPEDRVIRSIVDVEQASLLLRQVWQMVTLPVGNVRYLLENQGIRVFECALPTEHFHGLTTYLNDVPVMALSNDVLWQGQPYRMSTVRRRLTALHELAHLLLDFTHVGTKKEIEVLCTTFAGMVLLPKQRLVEAIGEQPHSLTIDDLKLMKTVWGISLQAILWRALDWELLDRPTVNKLLNQIKEHPDVRTEKNGVIYAEPWEDAYQGSECAYRFEQLKQRSQQLHRQREA